MPAEDVTAVVRSRLRGRRVGDGSRLALVIEGGGMRGIVSAAMACVIEETGILDVVDLVIGTSSGGVNAAAAASGQIGPMTASYVEIFSSREFIDVRRVLGRRAVVDSPYIVAHIDELFGIGSFVGGLDGPKLAVVATDIATATAVPLTDFTDRADMLDCVHASGLLPLLGGGPLELRGRRWLDGGIVEPVPVRSAAALGATHAIVLSTRPVGTGPSSSPMDRIVVRHLHGLNPALASAYAQRGQQYGQTIAAVARGVVDGVDTLLLAPEAGAPSPSRLDRSPERLQRTLDASRLAALAQLADLGLVSPGATGGRRA